MFSKRDMGLTLCAMGLSLYMIPTLYNSSWGLQKKDIEESKPINIVMKKEYTAKLDDGFSVLNALDLEGNLAREIAIESKEDVEEVPVFEVAVTENVVEQKVRMAVAPFPMESLGKFKVRGFCNCGVCSSKYANSNSSGMKNYEGVNVVADASVIPNGTKVSIEGVGIRQVQPNKLSVKGREVLVYFDKHSDVEKFGEKEIELFKLD